MRNTARSYATSASRWIERLSSFSAHTTWLRPQSFRLYSGATPPSSNHQKVPRGGSDRMGGADLSTRRRGSMRRAIAVLIAILTNIMPISIAPAPAAVSPLVDLASADAVLRWINAYRSKPDPGGVPAVVKALSRLGAFKDPESSGA